MKTVFLLVLCTTTFSAGESATTPSPMSCTMDGNITYTGVPDGVKSVASDCGLPTLNVTTHTIVITGCPVATAVTVNLYNTIVPTPPTPTTHPFMIDGSGALNLTCTQVTNGQTYTVKVQFPGSVTPTVFASEEQISLTMSLTDHSSNTSPTTVALGQTYDLHVSGGGTHFLKIKTCEAAEDDKDTGTVPVYNSISGSNFIGLTTPDGGGVNGSLTATFKGFRLVTSSVVFLQCDIYVCSTASCPAGTKRKRTKPKLKTASVRFEVMSTRLAQAANGARDMNSAGRNTMTLVLVVVASYLSF